MLSLLCLNLFYSRAFAAEDGLARTPPMGWRSWNLYGRDVNQDLMTKTMDGFTAKTREVDGIKVSLCDVGYCNVGLDDYWQECGAGKPFGTSFHDAAGNPIVNQTRFPDFNAMNAYAHNLNLTTGWYGNNCGCAESKTADAKYYQGDVNALVGYGFDGVKLDGCGVQLDLDLYYNLVNDSGRPIVIENCHWGDNQLPDFQPTLEYCPFHFFRTSHDIRANYGSMIDNLQTVTKYAQSGLSRPGCWAYPDMLEVGCSGHFKSDTGLNEAETRSHFYAWAIVSSPLTLSMDVNNDTVMDAVWPVITNPEALEVSRSWEGFSGGPFVTNTSNYQYYYKPMSDDRMAVLLMNSKDTTQDLTLTLTDVPGIRCARDGASSCNIRDINARKDLGSFTGSYKARQVVGHDAVFLILS